MSDEFSILRSLLVSLASIYISIFTITKKRPLSYEQAIDLPSFGLLWLSWCYTDIDCCHGNLWRTSPYKSESSLSSQSPISEVLYVITQTESTNDREVVCLVTIVTVEKRRLNWKDYIGLYRKRKVRVSVKIPLFDFSVESSKKN